MYSAESSQIGESIKILVLQIHVIGFSRVQPPTVHAQIEYVFFISDQ